MTEKQKVEVKKQVPSVDELLAAGVHFGHTTRRWHPIMKQFIFKQKNNVHVIDIRKTQEQLQKAVDFMVSKLQQGKRDILIVGTKRQISGIVKEFGQKYNTYYVTEKWLGGLFTNFKVVQGLLNNLEKLEEEQIKLRHLITKHELAVRDRKIKKLKERLEGVMFMRRLPDMVVVIDTKYEKIAVKEALQAKIPTIGVVDTNSDYRHVDFPIPANDDAIKSIKLLLSVFAQVITDFSNERLGDDRRNYVKRLQDLENRIENEYQSRMAVEQTKDKSKVAMPTATIMEDGDAGRIIKVAATPLTNLNLPESTIEKLEKSGVRSVEMLSNKSVEELRAVEGIGPKTAEKIIEELRNYQQSK